MVLTPKILVLTPHPDAAVEQGGMDLRGKAQRGAFDPASLMPADALKACAAMHGNSRVLGRHVCWGGGGR